MLNSQHFFERTPFIRSVVVWIVWLCATFAGWFTGWMISFWLLTHFDPAYIEFFLLYIFYIVVNHAFGLAWAVLAGAGQALVLLVQRAKGWFLWGLPTFVGLMVVWIFRAENFWAGLLGGLLAGVGQWLILRQSVTCAGWWIPANALIWGLSLGGAGAYTRIAANSRMAHWQLSEGITFGLIASLIMGVGVASVMTLLWSKNRKFTLGVLALVDGCVATLFVCVATVAFVAAPLPASSYTMPQWKLTNVAITSDGRWLLSRSSFSWCVNLWDLETMELAQALPVDDWSQPKVFLFQSDDHVLIREAAEMILWDIERGAEANRIPRPAGRYLWEQVVAPDGRAVLMIVSETSSMVHSVNDDMQFFLHLWDTSHGQTVYVLDDVVVSGDQGSVSGRFSPDGKLLAVGIGPILTVWDVAQRTRLYSLDVTAEEKPPVTFSPDTSLLVARVGHQVSVWDTASGELRHTIDGVGRGVTAWAFSPDGSTLAIAGGDYTTKSWTLLLWDVNTGEAQWTLAGQDAAVLKLAFSPDGCLLASADKDYTVRVWETASGKKLRSLTRRGFSPPLEIAFAEDGRLMVAGAGSAEIGVWVIEP